MHILIAKVRGREGDCGQQRGTFGAPACVGESEFVNDTRVNLLIHANG